VVKKLAENLPRPQQVTDPDAKQEAAALITSTTAALGELTASPESGTRSPLAIASMAELMQGVHPEITHALLVRGHPGSAGELVDQRFIVDDKVFIAAAMSITCILIGVGSHILAAGIEAATVEVHVPSRTRFSLTPERSISGGHIRTRYGVLSLPVVIRTPDLR